MQKHVMQCPFILELLREPHCGPKSHLILLWKKRKATAAFTFFTVSLLEYRCDICVYFNPMALVRCPN